MAEQDRVFTDLPNSFIDETVQICIVTTDLDRTGRCQPAGRSMTSKVVRVGPSVS